MGFIDVEMKMINLDYHPNDSRIKIKEDDICQSLTSRMGTGGGNVPLILQIDEADNTDRKEVLRLVRG